MMKREEGRLRREKEEERTKGNILSQNLGYQTTCKNIPFSSCMAGSERKYHLVLKCQLFTEKN